MDLRDFAKSVDRTRNPDLSPEQLANNYAMGLAGESGEVVELIKKQNFHGKQLPLHRLIEEVGDVLFYLQGLATRYGFTLEEAMIDNRDKLLRRYPHGFLEGGGIR